MQNKNIFPNILIGLGILLLIFGLMTIVKGEKSFSGMSLNPSARWSDLGNTGVRSGVLVTTSSTLVLASSTNREYAEISNLTGSAIYCNMDYGRPAVMYTGVMIPASSTKVLNSEFAYNGAVTCIGLSNSSTTVYSKQ